MKLTVKQTQVLAALRAHAESDDGNGWWTVYLDNARADLTNMSARSFGGILGSLAVKGFYRDIECRRSAFGQVKVEVSDPLDDFNYVGSRHHY